MQETFEQELNKIDPSLPLEEIQTYSQALSAYRGGLMMKSKKKLVEDMVHLMSEQMKLCVELEAKGVKVWFVNGKFHEITFEK